jgi:CRP-like cAMP-binding protein
MENLSKNEFYLEAGQKCTKIGFLESGMLCSFIYSQEGEEVVKHFVKPLQFFADIDSYEQGKQAILNLQAVMDSRILYITKQANQNIQKDIPQWGYVLKQFAADALNQMIKTQNFLHFGSAEEKYHHLMERHPYILQNAPLKFIASYLGITQSSLSRIRRQLE